MNDAVDLLLGKNAVEPGAVAHVHLIEFQRPARDLFDPSARLRAAVDKIVHHDDIHALLKQLHARVAADVAHAAGHQYGHAPYLLVFAMFSFIVHHIPAEFNGFSPCQKFAGRVNFLTIPEFSKIR